jgi:hypothetical protein
MPEPMGGRCGWCSSRGAAAGDGEATALMAATVEGLATFAKPADNPWRFRFASAQRSV